MFTAIIIITKLKAELHVVTIIVLAFLCPSICFDVHKCAHSTTDPVYEVPDDILIELKQKVNTMRSAPQNNERSDRQEIEEEIDEKPVLASNREITTKSRTTEPLVLTIHTSNNIPSEQMGDERQQRCNVLV